MRSFGASCLQAWNAPLSNKDKNPTRAILVLGCPVNSDGTPGPGLLCRLQQALSVAQQDPTAPIIVSGGNPYGPCEAVAMQKWLVEQGIDPKRIHLESQAYSTVENAEFSAPILKSLGVSEVAVITERFHLKRGTTLVKRALKARHLDSINVRSIAAKDHLSPKSAAARRMTDENSIERSLVHQQEVQKQLLRGWSTTDTFEASK